MPHGRLFGWACAKDSVDRGDLIHDKGAGVVIGHVAQHKDGSIDGDGCVDQRFQLPGYCGGSDYLDRLDVPRFSREGRYRSQKTLKVDGHLGNVG